jgi:hypothetical protein
MSEELQCATGFTSRSGRAVEFTIPDRTGDTLAETVRYEWSGTAGSPLLRTFNGGNAAAVVSKLETLSFGYDVDSQVTEETTTTYVDSSEMLLASFSTFPIGTTASDLSVTNTSWAAEVFTAVDLIPGDATQLRITRATLTMRRAPGAVSGSSVIVGIHPVAALTNAISATPIGTPVSRPASTVGTSYTTVTFNFSDVTTNSPLQCLAIVAKATASPVMQMRLLSSLTGAVNTTSGMWTTNSGSTWQPILSLLNQNELPFSVYGVYQTKVVNKTNVTRYYVKRVRAQLKLSGGSQLPVAFAAGVLNAPEVASP